MRVWALAQTACALLDDATESALSAIAGDRSRPLKHIVQARIVLLSLERLSVQDVARQAGASRPAVWRWQQRFAEEGVAGLLRDKTRPPGTPPHSTRTVAKVLALTCSEPPDEVTHWTGVWTRGLLIRRSLSDGERAYFTTWCPAGTPIATLVAVEGQCWTIEDTFETAKTELELAHNEIRSWHGWHRHVSLVMMAFALLAVIRHHANAPPPKDEPGRDHAPEAAGPLIRWSVQEIRRLAVRLAQRRIQPAHVIAWSLWRRAHQAAARNAHLKRRASADTGHPRRKPSKTSRRRKKLKTQL